MLFSEKLDRKLLQLVRDNPVLYDYSNVKYMDFNAREVAWQRIGDDLKQPAADCKVRWINIRDVYRRILKKDLKDSEQRRKMYKYENELAFMRPFYKDVTVAYNGSESDTKTNDQNSDDCCNDGSDIDDDKPIRKLITKQSYKSGSKKKKKKRYEEQEQVSVSLRETTPPSEHDTSDPVDSFLLSIGATLKTFSPYHLNLAKSKIFSVVQDHDLQQIMQKQRSDGPVHDALDKYSDYMH